MKKSGMKFLAVTDDSFYFAFSHIYDANIAEVLKKNKDLVSLQRYRTIMQMCMISLFHKFAQSFKIL